MVRYLSRVLSTVQSLRYRPHDSVLCYAEGAYSKGLLRPTPAPLLSSSCSRDLGRDVVGCFVM